MMPGQPKPDRVREPVQVYLDAADRDVLQALSERTGLSKAELLRRGLRRLADDTLAAARPGASLDVLIGALGHSEPADLSVRHDEYLSAPPPVPPEPPRGRRRSR